MSQREGGPAGEPGRLEKSSQGDETSLTREADNRAHPKGVGFFEWTKAVRRLELTSSTKLVALVMGLYATTETGENVRPGQERIGLETGMSARNVRRHLAILEQCGLLECVSRGSSHGRAGLASHYRLTVPPQLGTEDTRDL